MTENTKKNIVVVYNMLLPILAVISLFTLMSTGGMYFHLKTQPVALVMINHLIWAFFTVDFLGRLSLSKRKRYFFTTHLAEFISILPVAPIILIINLFSGAAARVPSWFELVCFLIFFFSYLIRAFMMQRRFFKTNQFHYALAVTMTALVVAAILFSNFEGRSYGDGIWWAFVTASTTGFGDVVPATTAGRIVGMFLMVVGLACVSMLTGIIAKKMLEEDTEVITKNKHVRLIIKELSAFEKLTPGQVEQICDILKTLKEHQETDYVEPEEEDNFRMGPLGQRIGAFVRRNFKPDPEEDRSLEKNFTEQN